MTRLKPSDITDIALSLDAYETRLRRIVNHSLWEIACRAASLKDPVWVRRQFRAIEIRIVPVKSELGIVGGFTDAIRDIVSHLGFASACTAERDVAGLAEAYGEQANLVFMADDRQFVLFDLDRRTLVDNMVATARGFVCGLELMADGLKNRTVLVLGCGALGTFAVCRLLQCGASVRVCDIDATKPPLLIDRVRKAVSNLADSRIKIESGFVRSLNEHRLVVDASDGANIIGRGDMGPDVLIAAPGMPCGITEEAMEQYPDQILHDPLQLGVATMLALALKGRLKKKTGR